MWPALLCEGHHEDVREASGAAAAFVDAGRIRGDGGCRPDGRFPIGQLPRPRQRESHRLGDDGSRRRKWGSQQCRQELYTERQKAREGELQVGQ